MIPLPISNLTDFSKLYTNDVLLIEILNTIHSFSPDSDESGHDIKYQPIFGSNVYINGLKTTTNSYGLPTLLFPRGKAPFINFVNYTKFVTNVHFHGFVNTGLADGASAFGVFGPSTLLGTSVNIQLPIIQNNSALCWYHSHNKFMDAELVYAGIVGSIIVTDDISKPFTDSYIYGDNHIVLNCLDMDLDEDGRQIFGNIALALPNRSCFTVINGISTIQWYKDPSTPSVKYSNILRHETNKNIVKIDFLNATANFRVLYLGVCDVNENILPFYVIQTDQGLCAPVKTTMQFVPVGGRISILLDLTNITSAYLFAYDYDLTAVYNMLTSTTGTYPNFENYSETPFPSPIPDNPSYPQNQQQIPSVLTYPTISIIPQVNQPLVNGRCPIPNIKLKRLFLYITNVSGNNTLSMQNEVTKINSIIYKNGIPPLFDTDYFSNLNPKYYYNIPNVNSKTPSRNICIWEENDLNYVNGGPGNAYIMNSEGVNIYGVTEFCIFSGRIRSDLWNSTELDLNEALIEYSKFPNNYKPKVLPSSEFRVTKTNDDYINIAMISNDTYTIQGFKDSISYNDTTSIPIFSVTIVIPPTNTRENLNIQQWINVLNNSLRMTNITVNGKTFSAFDVLSFDWSFFPLGVNLLNGTTTYFKSAVIKTKNNSNYCIRILGRWAMLQMMGKSLNSNTNQTPPIPNSGPCCSVDAPCDEEYLYGIYNNYVQSFYPYYATNDENVQKPILCPRRDGQLIIQATQTYIGFYHDMSNDNVKTFSTKLRSTEIWTYLNGDIADSHPLHFHLTSGFSYPSLSLINSTPGTPSDEEVGLTQTFSRDIYLIGPQQSLSFAITWPYYSSEETTSAPYLPNIGAVIHCHFLSHYDENSFALIYAINPESNIVSDICFPAGTPVQTDQGILPIETILPSIHTIDSKKIIHITKSISLSNYLVCFGKNSLGNNIPSKKTILSKTHTLFYKNKMRKADWFIGKLNDVIKIEYHGTPLYNVLMENHDVMIVNNIVCETLHPENPVAKLYKLLENKDVDINNYSDLIDKHNYYSISSYTQGKNMKRK
jgi:FtsP/CotA-like multicopper oxidase with cupredoxin domain